MHLTIYNLHNTLIEALTPLFLKWEKQMPQEFSVSPRITQVLSSWARIWTLVGQTPKFTAFLLSHQNVTFSLRYLHFYTCWALCLKYSSMTTCPHPPLSAPAQPVIACNSRESLPPPVWPAPPPENTSLGCLCLTAVCAWRDAHRRQGFSPIDFHPHSRDPYQVFKMLTK